MALRRGPRRCPRVAGLSDRLGPGSRVRAGSRDAGYSRVRSLVPGVAVAKLSDRSNRRAVLRPLRSGDIRALASSPLPPALPLPLIPSPFRSLFAPRVLESQFPVRRARFLDQRARMRADDQVAGYCIDQRRGAHARCPLCPLCLCGGQLRFPPPALAVVRRPLRIVPLRREGTRDLRRARGLLIELGVGIARAEGGRRRLRAEPVAERRDLPRLVRREAQHPRRIAHRAPPTPGDVLAHHRRVLAAVSRVHVLQHPLPFAVREVDVDVGRLVSLLAQESLE